MLRTFPGLAALRTRRRDPDVPARASDPQPHAAREPARLSHDGRAGRHRDDGPSVAARCEHARIHPAQRHCDDLGDDSARLRRRRRGADGGHRACVEPLARGAARDALAASRSGPARVHSRALLQRTAGDGDGDARCAWRVSTTTITKSSSSTTTRPMPRRGSPSRRIARRSGPASSSSISTM